MVNMDNAEEYVELMFDFCMQTGVQKQMDAFRGNFNYSRLCTFSLHVDTQNHGFKNKFHMVKKKMVELICIKDRNTDTF